MKTLSLNLVNWLHVAPATAWKVVFPHGLGSAPWGLRWRGSFWFDPELDHYMDEREDGC